MVRNDINLARRLRIPAAFILLMTIVFAGGIGEVRGQEAAEEAAASLRFIHASPDAPAIDVLVDGLPVAQGLEFGLFTDYAPVTPGDHQIQVVPAGEDAVSALIDETVGTDGGQAYTLAVANLLSDLELKVVQSNLDDLPEGEARVRMVNLSTDDQSVDVSQVGGDEWFGDVGFGDITDHRNVTEGSYDLDIQVTDADMPLVSVDAVQIDRGTETAFYLLGNQASDSLQVLTIVTSVNASCAVHLGLEGQNDDACVRVTHAAIDGPAVDVYVEDSLIVEGLEAGSTSDFVIVPAGDDRSVVLVPAGGTTDDQILDSGVDFKSGEARDVIIGGDISDLKVINDGLDLSPLASDQARVRTVNLSADAGDIDVLVTDGDALFEGVGFESFSDTILMDTGTYRLQVEPSDSDEILFRSEAVMIDPGMSYNLVAAGSVENGTFTMLAIPAPAQLRAGEAVAAASAGATPLSGLTPTPAAEIVDATPTT
ncbi:MAG: DUF4397 domain-containing protein [Thermomicrobiales bacterium]